MHDINEAYKILYDEESKVRYNIDYQIFNRYRRSHQVKKCWKDKEYWNYEYDVKDDNLKDVTILSRPFFKKPPRNLKKV